ncbi:MAG: DUF3662 domain-containing protein [Armatimonadetes bacterium]|nr:DUF3662 domain-containing protein [Armatimonadota bacterium]
MDIFEKLNKAFAGWYESWFGNAESDIRPRDVLRKIINAMEDNRKEGIDGKVYVPNKYVLELNFESDEERDYLLAFLDKAELESALRKYMAQNKYYLRGPLDFTIEELSVQEGKSQLEKLRVKCKWDVRPAEKEIEMSNQICLQMPYKLEEEHTVPAVETWDDATIAPPTLIVNHVDGRVQQFTLNKPDILIGRSKRLDNDLVLDKDGMVSKRHARITLGEEGFTIRDLNSTNGVWVNDERIESHLLRDGDRIRLGATQMVFKSLAAELKISPLATSRARRPRLLLKAPSGTEEFLLASEVIIGKSLTSDVRIMDTGVESNHARVFSPDGIIFYLEDLGSRGGTRINGELVPAYSPVRLLPGDKIIIGKVEIGFEMD